jgi:hypothetical protein
MATGHGQVESPATTHGDRGRAPSSAARRLLWIVAYYVAVGIVVGALWRSSPAVRELLASDRLRDMGQGGLPTRADASVAIVERASVGGARTAELTLLVLAGALAASMPVAWVYSLTRRRKGFDQSMVHTLILLPIAIGGLVMLIQNSLALAFSLAGIVALLRFRNTLDDTKDGVYVFIVTTIGISSAVGLLFVGVVTSLVFNTVVLTLWWLDFARTPTLGIRGGIRRLARLPTVAPLRPRANGRPPPDGATALDDPAFATAAEAWRRQLQLTAEQRILDPTGRFNTRLRIHTLDPDASQRVVGHILDEQARRWELVGVMPAEGNRYTLKYLLRLRRDARGDLLNAVREQGAPQVVGMEFR